jgi:hypothetical protein
LTDLLVHLINVLVPALHLLIPLIMSFSSPMALTSSSLISCGSAGSSTMSTFILIWRRVAAWIRVAAFSSLTEDRSGSEGLPPCRPRRRCSACPSSSGPGLSSPKPPSDVWKCIGPRSYDQLGTEPAIWHLVYFIKYPNSRQSPVQPF